MAQLRVFTFTPAWGLPSSGPFALKLLAWLNLAGIAYEQAFEDDPRKGPLGKSPWIELDGKRIGDTEYIIELLGKRYSKSLDNGLTAQDRAIAHAWVRTFEEHFHQILEWELFCRPEGMAFIKTAVAAQAPPIVRTLIPVMLRQHFRRQLYARGIRRHSPDIVAAKGRADVDALAAFLASRDFLVTGHPTTADAAVFGQLAPMVYWSMQTPVATYARTVPAILAFCERMRDRCFSKTTTRSDSTLSSSNGRLRRLA